uniref:Trypsin-like serine protease n=1 Tax=Paraleonnates uschakovi TaxID=232278 RepID=Q6XMP3_PARUS|nr:trypsin-like serine protease [Periserrula leucophryna]
MTFTHYLTFIFLLTFTDLQGSDVNSASEVKQLARLLQQLLDKDVDKRIIGGEVISDDMEQPWLVSLTTEVTVSEFLGFTIRSRTIHCAGSLISREWVLTSANCFMQKEAAGQKPEQWTARYGDKDLEASFWESLFGSKDKWERQGKYIVVHEKYNPGDHWLNDIALLRMTEPIQDVGQARPITIPDRGDDLYPLPNQYCIAMGWGCTEPGRDLTDRARQVEIPVLSDISCQRTWGVTTETRLCAGEFDKNKGICKGDNGGPLICKKNEQWLQAGIASFAHAQRPGQYPAVFTKVAAYSNWIMSHIK